MEPSYNLDSSTNKLFEIVSSMAGGESESSEAVDPSRGIVSTTSVPTTRSKLLL